MAMSSSSAACLRLPISPTRERGIPQQSAPLWGRRRRRTRDTSAPSSFLSKNPRNIRLVRLSSGNVGAIPNPLDADFETRAEGVRWRGDGLECEDDEPRMDRLGESGGGCNGDGGVFFKFTFEHDGWGRKHPCKHGFFVFLRGEDDDEIALPGAESAMLQGMEFICEDVRFEDSNGEAIAHGKDLMECLPLKTGETFDNSDIEAASKLLLLLSHFSSIEVSLEKLKNKGVIVVFRMRSGHSPSRAHPFFSRELIFLASSFPTTTSGDIDFQNVASQTPSSSFPGLNPQLNRDSRSLHDPSVQRLITENEKGLTGAASDTKETIDFEVSKMEQLANLEIEEGFVSDLYVSKFQSDLSYWLKKKTWLTPAVLGEFKDVVEKKYKENGFLFANVKKIKILNDGKIVTTIDEGLINRVEIDFKDKKNRKIKGKTEKFVITTEMSQLSPGNPYNSISARNCIANLMNLHLFEDVRIIPVVNKSENGASESDEVIVKVEVVEPSPKCMEMDLNWNFENIFTSFTQMSHSIFPGGSIFIEDKNLNGKNHSFYSSISTSNFFIPWDDLGFKMEYRIPLKPNTEMRLDGTRTEEEKPKSKMQGDKKGIWNDLFRHAVTFRAFNSRKPSPVFWQSLSNCLDSALSLGVDKTVWVDRVGFKMDLSNQSKVSPSFLNCSVVLENVKTRDETGQVISHVFDSRNEEKDERVESHVNALTPKVSTSHSGTGSDFLPLVQFNITRDKTKFSERHNSLLGHRSIIQIDQSLGGFFPLQNSPSFNRQIISHTMFSDLSPLLKFVSFLPIMRIRPVAVLHCKSGIALGDIPAYDLFLLGGPNSVRGYDLGEIACCNKFVEFAAELRIPISKSCVSYAFWECGSDLGSSHNWGSKYVSRSELEGSESEHGASAGFGFQFRNLRFEWIRESRSGAVSTHVRFGERF